MMHRVCYSVRQGDSGVVWRETTLQKCLGSKTIQSKSICTDKGLFLCREHVKGFPPTGDDNGAKASLLVSVYDQGRENSVVVVRAKNSLASGRSKLGDETDGRTVQ